MKLLAFPLIVLLPLAAHAQTKPVDDTPPEIPLWPHSAPGSEGKDSPEKLTRDKTGHVWRVNNIHHPSITPYLPTESTNTGASIIVLAGGGHRDLNIGPEGYSIGQWLANHGIAAFVVKYRLAREDGSTYKWDVDALADTQRAIRLVRSRATDFHVDPARLGVMGFSAGGELAYLASQRFSESPKDPLTNSADPIDQQDAKPAYQILIYPGTPYNIQPTKDSPPAFLAVGFKDNTSEALAEAYVRFHKANVPAELHVFAGAAHAQGFREQDHTTAATWRTRLTDWLADRGFLKPLP